MAQGNPRSVKLEATWRRHFKRQRSSGLTIRDYCSVHDLHESAFYFWRREIAGRDRATPAEPASFPAFVPVQVIEAPTSTRAVNCSKPGPA